MLRLLVFLSLLWAGLSLPLSAQGDRTDCRLQPEDLRPLIARFNPYFADHRWVAASQMEMARMGAHRLLLITQDGCKRHHTTFSLIIDPEAVGQGYAFWLDEMKALMHKVYWENDTYSIFGPELEAQFEDKLRTYGIGERFNFPIGTRNFICEVRLDPQKGGKLTIEMVSFLFKEEVRQRRAGIPDTEDHGWEGSEGRR
ncbi:MAG: hypothetical protein D6722_21065 [Bacteroidetes bacterium]|nr:MAG: hypothetical protein D6722_21065 [Bacteroidota bacterium]